MKDFSNIFLTIICLFLLVTTLSPAQAQTIKQEEEAAFYSDFYVMQIKPMKFRITYNFPASDKIQLRILDASGNILFGERVLVYKKYTKLFDLSTFRDGDYTFQLTDGKRELRHSINVVTRSTRTVSMKPGQGEKDIIVAGF